MYAPGETIWYDRSAPATPSGSVTFTDTGTPTPLGGCAGVTVTWRGAGGALPVSVELAAPGVGMPPASARAGAASFAPMETSPSFSVPFRTWIASTLRPGRRSSRAPGTGTSYQIALRSRRSANALYGSGPGGTNSRATSTPFSHTTAPSPT